MGGLSLKTIDKKNIENFVKNDNRVMSMKGVIWTAIINIVVFVISGYLGKNLVLQIIATIFILFIIISFLYFWRKVECCKKNLYLFFGIYGCMLSVSLSMVSYGVLLEQLYDKAVTLLIVDLIINAILFGGAVVSTIWKIKKDKYTYKTMQIVTTGMIALGMLLAKTLERSLGFVVVLGIFLKLAGYAFATQSDFFVRYACIEILGNTKD